MSATAHDLRVIHKMAHAVKIFPPATESDCRVGLSFGYPRCCVEFFCSYRWEDLDRELWKEYCWLWEEYFEIAKCRSPYDPKLRNEWTPCPRCLLAAWAGIRGYQDNDPLEISCPEPVQTKFLWDLEGLAPEK